MTAGEREYVEAHVHEALARDPRVNEPELQVLVVKARVLVTGIVPTEERRAAVTEVASPISWPEYPTGTP